MRKSLFLSFFLILSCVQVPSVMALEDLHILQDLEVSKHFMAMKETKGPNGTENMNYDAENFAAKHDAILPEKSQRSKGSGGGVNLVHHRPSEKSAAPVLQIQRSSVLIPPSTICISLFLLLVFPVLIV